MLPVSKCHVDSIYTCERRREAFLERDRPWEHESTTTTETNQAPSTPPAVPPPLLPAPYPPFHPTRPRALPVKRPVPSPSRQIHTCTHPHLTAVAPPASQEVTSHLSVACESHALVGSSSSTTWGRRARLTANATR